MKKIRTPEEIAALRNEASNVIGQDDELGKNLYRKARRWEREAKAAAEAVAEPFDIYEFIIAYEGGELNTEEEVIEGFQHLINNGMAWTLQGSYGRTAKSLIEAGYCTLPEGK